MPDTPSSPKPTLIPPTPTTIGTGFQSTLREGLKPTNETPQTINVTIKQESQSPQITTRTKTINSLPPDKNKKIHPHAIKWDDSFTMSLATILAIPILLLLALFDIIIKAAPWATGPS